ncbi:MAG: hypothetical protein JF922_13405 [Candidatus Dormibacteraeota bacterium]|uniref:Uncharacterized protein n=1 Tax=Candidatus Nephthysia bennettiae TaxID=3127016 RepID=A0A934KB18_9BACT|nr:hypothetical protein [Candidatus Dormibacteraeota bacterium]
MGQAIYAPLGDVSEETAAARREALARQVRMDAAGKRLTTIGVEVREHGGSWSLAVPELPGVDARATRRQDIEPAARAAIAAALQVPYHFFELHMRFRD